MDREIVLGVLVLVVCGPMLVLGGAIPLTSPIGISGRQLERSAWTRLLLPLVPSALVLVSLLGWALQEPASSDERFVPVVFLAALPFGFLVLRAGTRAVVAQLATPRDLAAVTVGLLRPRIILSPRLQDVLDPDALRAAEEHEASHARHRDPLRILIAQLTTDLQWPTSAAYGRFLEWRRALEVARDEEVRIQGVDGADLAAAVIAAARLQCPASTLSGLVGDGEALASRIARLLAPVPANPPVPRRGALVLVLWVGLVAAFAAGLRCGDTALRFLPGVRSASAEGTAARTRGLPPSAGDLDIT